MPVVCQTTGRPQATEAVWKLFEFFRRWGRSALQVLLAPASTTETRSPALKFSKSVAVYHLDFQILRFHTASAELRT